MHTHEHCTFCVLSMSEVGTGANRSSIWRAFSVNDWFYLECLSSDCGKTVAIQRDSQGRHASQAERAC